MSQNPDQSEPNRSFQNGHNIPRKTEDHGASPSSGQAHDAMADGKESFKHLVTEARDEMGRPTTGAAIAGAAVVGAATIWGVPAAILGATAAYVVYRVLKKQNAD